ncbi:hypothetical protein PPL_10425 [Heterostelium album PN500]|uniref:Ankyrin repeat protein n=1 Tax=Heterostelium pallidum (strain ATCC 26659 / Pp 5 / PN500) TaxID=670386 RepID=D3BR22_HETP5|nr:hypothetical protein PPL_10425 [Heterostelium album PN500]EFA75854.1 hypothetical protein PPL_10425 [Heterostelium album PN500]|eukprot:XP_020427988.1 hypothetical protein PPL_10425 [Heterostelium album PN500]
MFNNLIQSSYIRNNIFQFVKEIHSESYKRCFSWQQLINNPQQLILHNYNEQFYQFIKDFISNNGTTSERNYQKMLEYMDSSFLSAIKCNNIDIIRYLCDHHRKFVLNDMFVCSLSLSIKYNRLEIVRLLHSYIVEPINLPVMVVAAENGHLEMLKYLNSYPSVFPCSYEAIDKAATNGHFEVIRYLRENRTEGYLHAVDGASINGHYEIIKYLESEYGPLTFSDDAVNLAVMNGHLAIAKHLHAIKPAPRITIEHSIKKGQQDVLEWYLSIHPNISNYNLHAVLSLSIKYGHMHLVRFLIEKYDNILLPSHFGDACICGHIEVVKYIESKTTVERLGKDIIAMIAFRGHLEIIKHLHQTDKSVWSIRVLNQAKKRNNYEIVQFLIENRPEFSTQ